MRNPACMAVAGLTVRAIPAARDAVLERVRATDAVSDQFAAASARLRRFVPFDAAVWTATDPTTGLPSAPTRSENMACRYELGPKQCVQVWETEFLTADVNLYSDLAQADAPAGALQLATGHWPARSPRFRSVLSEKGFGDELRAVLRVDGRPWGLVSLFRDGGRPPSTATRSISWRACRHRLRRPSANAHVPLRRQQAGSTVPA